jgi:hypothetical protein
VAASNDDMNDSSGKYGRMETLLFKIVSGGEDDVYIKVEPGGFQGRSNVGQGGPR